MAETPKSTFRFEDDVRAAIDGLLTQKFGRDKTEVVSRAILAAKDGVGENDGVKLSAESKAAVRWWAKQDRASENEIIEDALVLYDSHRSGNVAQSVPPQSAQHPLVERDGETQSRGVRTFAGNGLKDVVEVQKRFNDPAAIAGVSVGVPRSTDFPCQCIHSGCRGSKFTGASKFANLCPECEESGHRGNQRECQECFNDTGPA